VRPVSRDVIRCRLLAAAAAVRAVALLATVGRTTNPAMLDVNAAAAAVYCGRQPLLACTARRC